MDMFQQMQQQHQQSVREMERLHREAVERMRSGNRGTGVAVKADHSEYESYKRDIDAFDITDFSSVKAANIVARTQLAPRPAHDILDGINTLEDVKAFFEGK